MSDRMVLGACLDDLARDNAEWSQAAFGSDATKGPIGALKHLGLEVREAIESAQEVAHLAANDVAPTNTRQLLQEELADCLILLLDANRRAGFAPLELVKAAQHKMIVNRARKWPTPKPGDEPTEHVREPGILDTEAKRDEFRELYNDAAHTGCGPVG